MTGKGAAGVVAMAKNTVSLVLNGDVTLEDFSRAIGAFGRLLEALRTEVAGDAKIEWVVEEMAGGSATTVFRGEVEDEADQGAVTEVVDAFEQVGVAVQSGKPVPYLSAAPYLSQIRQIVDGRVTSVVLGTEAIDAELALPVIEAADSLSVVEPGPRETFGTVRGRVQTMTNRHRYRFTLFEQNTDRAVSCYYEQERENEVKAAYGNMAVVEGWVRRNPYTGQPTSIRQITNIVVFPTIDRGSYRQARGVAPGPVGGLSPEAAVRKVRDG